MIFPAILAMIAATMYALTNHIDKYLISKAVKNADYRSLLMASTLIAGGLMALIYFFICGCTISFDWRGFIILFINAIVVSAAYILYFKSLSREDTTIVAIMFQLIPVFMLVLSPLFLPDQGISPIQLAGGLIATMAAVLITYEPSKKRFNKGRLVTLAMMALVSIAYAIYFILERYVVLDHDFNQTMFSFGNVLSTWAGTMASVALVSFVSQSVQPFAVMGLGILITACFPKIERECVTKSEIIKRILAIVICVIGLACIEFG